MQGWDQAWGEGWRAAAEYRTADFAAELAFWRRLGFADTIVEDAFALLSTPDGVLSVAFARADAGRGKPPTPPGTLTLHLNVADLDQAAGELGRRGIALVDGPRPYSDAFPAVRTAAARTPAGVSLRLFSSPGSR